MKKNRTIAWALALTALAVPRAGASIISVNFAENTNQGFAGGQNIGPLATDSANWNNTINRDSGTLAEGSMGSLKDDSGVNTGASISWSSKNVWYNSAGIGSDEAKLNVGYLDDGAHSAVDPWYNEAAGAYMTISNVPYTSYRVYGLLASDAGDTYAARNFLVNGTYVWSGRNTNADAYGNIGAAFAATGNNWVKLEQGVTRGNYWTFDVLDAPSTTLQVYGIDGYGGGRGSIGGVIIEQIPEPATAGLLGLIGAVALLRRRLQSGA